MKKSARCPKCDSPRVGHFRRQLDRSGEYDTAHERMVGTAETGLVFTVEVMTGAMEAYVCTECGYFESYVVSPRSVAFDKLEGFRWVNPETPEEGPYR